MLNSHYGSFSFSPGNDLVAGQYVQFKLIYKAGSSGIDEIGGIRIALRLASDISPFQFDEPDKPGYTTIVAPDGNKVAVTYEPHGGLRPWYKLLKIQFSKALLPDDEIHILFGGTREDSPGVRMQTFCENVFQFKCTADPFGTNNYIDIPCAQAIKVVPDFPVSLRIFLPSTTKTNKKFGLKATAVDRWGNPCDVPAGKIKINSNFQIENLPSDIVLAESTLPLIFNGLSIKESHVSLPHSAIRIELDHVEAKIGGRSNPCVVSNANIPVFWADLHGQSGESIGTNSAREYFQFAKDSACVDIVSHQANDFQISHAFWMHLNNLTESFDSPGDFLAIPGYEWSGNTHLGGDHNVYFRNETETIARAHKALITDSSLPFADALNITALFEKFNENEINAVVNAHVGGRHADLSRGHDPHYRCSIEIHSAWGTFEWLLHQAFELEQRVGIVCASDDHHGRPGASHPGTSLFGALGGLTAYMMRTLNRDNLFDAMRNRHHYGTTGCRMFMDVKLYGENELSLLGTNGKDEHIYIDSYARMGNVVETCEESLKLACTICGTAPVLSVELFDGVDKIGSYSPHALSNSDRRVRVLWHGANCRDRKRVTVWNGQLRVGKNNVDRIEAINFFNPEKQPQLEGGKVVKWESGTAGGFAGLDLYLQKSTGRIAIETVQGEVELEFNEEFQEKIYPFGGLGKKITVQRLPEKMTIPDVECTFEITTNIVKENKLYIKVQQEDGHVGWSSPIYLSRKEEGTFSPEENDAI